MSLPANRIASISRYLGQMNRRVLFLMVLLIAGLVVLLVMSGGAEQIRNRVAYAGWIPQRDNLRDSSRVAALDRYDRGDRLVPTGATVILGDSIALRAPFKGPCVVNRGIGGERSDQLLANLERWPSLGRAGAVVLAVGTNDVWQWRPETLERNVAAILERIEAPVLLIGLTANLDGVDEANEILRRTCRANCTYFKPVAARAEDGIHLTRQGYAQIAGRAPLTCPTPSKLAELPVGDLRFRPR